MNATIRFASTAAALAAAAALLAGPAQAQQLTRAEVQQQTLAAIKAGDMPAAGEGRPQGPESLAASTKTREQRKSETMQARRNGELYPGGLGTYVSNVVSQQKATANSTKTRAERKSETLQAIKDHKTMQPGEAA